MTSTARSLTFHQSYEPANNETTTRLEVRKLLRRGWFTSYREQHLGAMLSVCGVAWFANTATQQSMAGISGLITPAQVCGLGAVIWLHARWRRSIRVDI